MHSQEIACRCNAVALRIAGDPVAQIYCHCDDCQMAHSAAYVAAAIYPSSGVQVLRGDLVPLVIHNTARMRCVACATYLFSEITSVGLRSVNAYLLPAGQFKPQLHVQCQHAVLPVVDDLPHYKGFPPAFGGSDERVDW